jgi:hypothetical protein
VEAVHDAQAMRFSQRFAVLQHELHRLLDGQHALLIEPSTEISALQVVLHDLVRRAVVERANVDDARHMLVSWVQAMQSPSKWQYMPQSPAQVPVRSLSRRPAAKREQLYKLALFRAIRESGGELRATVRGA